MCVYCWTCLCCVGETNMATMGLLTPLLSPGNHDHANTQNEHQTLKKRKSLQTTQTSLCVSSPGRREVSQEHPGFSPGCPAQAAAPSSPSLLGVLLQREPRWGSSHAQAHGATGNFSDQDVPCCPSLRPFRLPAQLPVPGWRLPAICASSTLSFPLSFCLFMQVIVLLSISSKVVDCSCCCMF